MTLAPNRQQQLSGNNRFYLIGPLNPHFMKYSKILLFPVFLLVGTTLSAQEGIDYQQKYRNAKAFFEEGKYNLAMEAFKPVIKKSSSNPYSAYASFYFALSAYHQGYVPMAKDMLLQLKSLHPGWNNMDEANLWLGSIYLQEKEYNKAISTLKSIKAKDLQENIRQQKRYHLSQINDFEELATLYKNNPEDGVLGELLALKISAQPLGQQDQALLASLVKKFKLDKERFEVAEVPKSVKKDSYKVAVLLPFMVDDWHASQSRKGNQFVLDLFEGIRMAQEQLEEEGVNVELMAFDTKRSGVETRKILANPALARADLIIGPLYSGPSQLALDFSFRNKINIVNPLSANSDIIGKNPFSFLYYPSNETIGREAGRYAASHTDRSKPGIIFYGDTKADSLRAYNYKQEVEAAGYEIVLTKEIPKGESKEILNMLTETYERGRTKEFVIPRDSLGSIYVASDNSLIAASAASAVEIRGDSISLIGSSRWLGFKFVDYEAYERLGVALVAPNHVSGDQERVQALRDKYIAAHAKSPADDKFYQGFGLMHFFGRCLDQYGNYFQHELHKAGFETGYLVEGHDYTKSNDNQVVPVVKFRESGLEKVNHLTRSNN